MKTRSRQHRRQFQLQILSYGNGYYIERIADLETALARKPRTLQINMVGVGEIPADSALLIRSVLMNRWPRTKIITHARSSLQGGSVLVWLLGDSRIIRDDARLYFRRANVSENDEPDNREVWKEAASKYWDSSCDIDPEEGDYARVLQLINEFLPVNELAGRLIEVSVLRQFGLVESEKADNFLATAFARQPEIAREPRLVPKNKRLPRAKKVSRSTKVRK